MDLLIVTCTFLHCFSLPPCLSGEGGCIMDLWFDITCLGDGCSGFYHQSWTSTYPEGVNTGPLWYQMTLIFIYIPAACSAIRCHGWLLHNCHRSYSWLMGAVFQSHQKQKKIISGLGVELLLLNPCCWVSFPSFVQAGDHCTSRCFPGTRRWLLGGPSSY